MTAYCSTHDLFDLLKVDTVSTCDLYDFLKINMAPLIKFLDS